MVSKNKWCSPVASPKQPVTSKIHTHTHTHTHLNSRWRVLIFRVQLMSLEYNRKVSSRMSFDSHITQLHSSYLNRGTQKQRQFRGGPKGHSQTSQLQVRPADQAGYHELTASVFVGAGLAETPCAPCCETERVVTGHSVTPHTHAPRRRAMFLFSPAGRSNAHTQVSIVDQNILHGEGSETPP